MPLYDPTHKAPTPEEWNQIYVAHGSKWFDMQPGELIRRNQALDLIGEVNGKTFLDLGGGPLLCKVLLDMGATRLKVVEMSSKSCDIIKEISPATETVVGDMIEYLQTTTDRFDVTICMGVLQYIPPIGLSVLFKKCPSNELVLGMAACEGYLIDYQSRITVYSRDETTGIADQYGWDNVKDHNTQEHVSAKYQRRVPR